MEKPLIRSRQYALLSSPLKNRQCYLNKLFPEKLLKVTAGAVGQLSSPRSPTETMLSGKEELLFHPADRAVPLQSFLSPEPPIPPSDSSRCLPMTSCSHSAFLLLQHPPQHPVTRCPHLLPCVPSRTATGRIFSWPSSWTTLAARTWHGKGGIGNSLSDSAAMKKSFLLASWPGETPLWDAFFSGLLETSSDGAGGHLGGRRLRFFDLCSPLRVTGTW